VNIISPATCHNNKTGVFSRDIEPIVKAILDNDVETVRLLVKQPSCNLLAPNKDGWIPLHEAAYYGKDQCIQILLRGKVCSFENYSV